MGVLTELRVAMCQTSPASKGIRDFWKKQYSAIKSANSSLPILLRESQGIQAKLTAAYQGGKETVVVVDGLSEAEFGAKLESLMKG
mmetsp:Transcript_31040/g.99259  ORF Transcript_31040/g.99259 Transcript_31040/m.99259 type:complete len:86 (+) Transcript_31040:21-278(+)